MRLAGHLQGRLSNNAGRGYNLAIREQFASVAQAVALNEYRGDNLHPYGSIGKFPLESILDNGTMSPIPVEGKTRIERGFIGAHADIGGGFAEGESQLALVALNWMVNQATAAGVSMEAAPATIAANPFVHDKSDSIGTGAPAANEEDREVRYRDGSKTTQRQMIPPGGMSFADTQNYIDYEAVPLNDPQRRQFKTGTVDMNGYLDWLNRNGYDINMTVQ